MSNYIDGFTLPIPKKYLDEYRIVSKQVAEIWKEYGAISYHEYVGDDLHHEGIRHFADATNAKSDEVVVFGWVEFESREARDKANAQVPKDARMNQLVGPLTNPSKLIFDASRMVYGGFLPLVKE